MHHSIHSEMSANAVVDVLIVGAGCFGCAAALELQRRQPTAVIGIADDSPLLLRVQQEGGQKERGSDSGNAGNAGTTVGGGSDPASSADVSKIIRGDYGADEEMLALHDIAVKRWKLLGERWAKAGYYRGESPLHWTGVTVLSQDADMGGDGSFVRDTLTVIERKKRRAEVLRGADAVARRFPAFQAGLDASRAQPSGTDASAGMLAAGYFNPVGGWVESGRANEFLLRDAAAAGVRLLPSRVEALRTGDGESGTRSCDGAVLADGTTVSARAVVVAAGAWTPHLVPETRALLRPVAQPVFHFRPPTDAVGQQFAAPNLVPFTADIAKTGFYGFPLHPTEKIVKVGHHSEGYAIDAAAGASREGLQALAERVRASEEAKFRVFLARMFPQLRDAPVEKFRLCQYCDSHNSDFLIGAVPGYVRSDGTGLPSLVVASGGSGHGFKFMPLLGDVIADAVQALASTNSVLAKAEQRFSWRDASGQWTVEHARHVPKANL
jgi:glycine/D-amino acid oxidase-like deaminating enzyme